MNETQAKQVIMHKDFFDRCQFAIDNGFYLEAIFLEYAAIEGRLEVILGVLGSPCNKMLDSNIRKKINISERVKCCKRVVHRPVFEKSKLDVKFYEDLSKWLDKRNRYVHGLYKKEAEYKSRMRLAKTISVDGLELCRLLYNEAKRVNRLLKKNPEIFNSLNACVKPCFNN